MSQSKTRILKRAYKNYLKDYNLTSEDLSFDQFKELFLQFLFDKGFFDNGVIK